MKRREEEMRGERAMPMISAGKPVVIRMSGTWEEFNINTTILRKRLGYSDVIISRWYDDTISITSRTCNLKGLLGNAVGDQNNNFILRPKQMEVVRHMLQ